MRRDPVRVSRSILDPVAIADFTMVLYRMPRGTTARLVSSGLNDVYRIDSEGFSRYLRVSPSPWRTRPEIEAELQWIRDCAAAGLPVVRVLQSRDGGLVEHLTAPEGRRAVVLFAPVQGAEVIHLTTERAAAVGMLMAKLHQVADQSPVQYDRFLLDANHLVTNPANMILEQAEMDPADRARFRQIATMVRMRIQETPRESAAFGMCHGDLHPGNVRFGTPPLPWVFDFDCCGYGWRAYDLAVFLWNIYGENRPRRYRESRWNAFLKGYRSVRKLDAAERQAIPWFMLARHIWLAGHDYSGASNWPPQWLTPASFSRFVRELETWIADFKLDPGDDQLPPEWSVPLPD
jgi:Ser/Thr protein kinase RdoA (MazF antagonist)